MDSTEKRCFFPLLCEHFIYHCKDHGISNIFLVDKKTHTTLSAGKGISGQDRKAIIFMHLFAMRAPTAQMRSGVSGAVSEVSQT